MKWRVETQVSAGFVLALGVFMIMGALVYHSTQTLVETNRAAQRSQRAVAALEEIYSLMSQAEAEQRLYLLTEDDTDLMPRANALARIRDLIAQLTQLTAGEPAIHRRVPELEQRVHDRQQLLDRVLDARRRGSFEEARELLRRLPGRAEMQRLKTTVSELQQAELTRLDSRERAARAEATRAEILIALLLGFVLIAVSVLYVRVRREMRQRQSAQQDLLRRAEELRASESRLRAVVDTATDGIIVIGEDGIVDRFNPAAERIFGYAAADVLGRNVSMLMPSPDREQHDGYLARYLAGGEPRIIGSGREVRARRKDGSTFPMDLAISEMHVGNRRMFTGIVRDISGRKRTEEQRATLIRELRSANEELEDFAYVVSHDLKAPLRAIGSLADWIETDYHDRLDTEGREHLQLLRSRVRRMDALIDGILEYSRIGRVRQALTAVPTDRVLKETIDLLAPPPHIRVLIDGTLPTVNAEPTRIRQVFQNLLSNAIKYMDKPDGIIRIACRPLDGMWQFSVADNGAGIDPRHYAKVFQLFQTLEPRDRVESTGVGLTLVKKIVELYGGRVWIDSLPGRGSTFYFTLPRDTAAAAPAEKAVP
jgi:two-component system sensor kinase FixL